VCKTRALTLSGQPCSPWSPRIIVNQPTFPLHLQGRTKPSRSHLSLQPGSLNPRPVLRGSAQSHRPIDGFRHTRVCWEGTSLEQLVQEMSLQTSTALPVLLEGHRQLCREHARCWGMLRPRAVWWRRQPWKPALVPHPQVPTIAGCVPRLPISFSLFKRSAIFLRAWGWHHLLIFLDVWRGAGGTRLSHILRTGCAAPCREQDCVDEACFGGKEKGYVTFKSELLTHFQPSK